MKSKLVDKEKHYIFLDEVQKVKKFEEVVNSLRASTDNTSIFITGSNSKLLSQELSTVLSGGYVLFNIFPLSYKKFTSFSGKKAKEEESFWNYVKWGWLPNRCEFTSENNIKVIIATNHLPFVRNFIGESFNVNYLENLILSAEIHKI